MKITTAAALMLSIGLGTGCASKRKEPPLPPPPTAAQLESLKADINAYSASAKFGVVTAVLESDSYIAIGGVDVEGVRKGDLFSIVDGAKNVIANATVTEIKDGKLFAVYEAVTRSPVVGDAALKF